jgi:NADPH:quinone reductase-like Zn-dependent oxidoreductase
VIGTASAANRDLGADEARALGVRHEGLLVEDDHTGMDAIRELVEDGKLRPEIAGTFALADAAKAHARGETRHVAGKLVLVMDS